MIVVRDREAGNIIEQVGSWEEGLNTIKKFEQQDIQDGCYSQDFYEVAEI
jgi:hypothetical protein